MMQGRRRCRPLIGEASAMAWRQKLQSVAGIKADAAAADAGKGSVSGSVY